MSIRPISFKILSGWNQFRLDDEKCIYHGNWRIALSENLGVFIDHLCPNHPNINSWSDSDICYNCKTSVPDVVEFAFRLLDKEVT